MNQALCVYVCVCMQVCVCVCLCPLSHLWGCLQLIQKVVLYTMEKQLQKNESRWL